MGRLFGTDGVRGIANEFLDCKLAMQLGRAAAYVLTKHIEAKPKILIGTDTRASSDMLEMAMAAGLCSVGADVVLVGYIPTPAVAYLVKKMDFDAGVMISASHNPCEYNGIKFFNGEGFKLADAVEAEIEAIVLDHACELPKPTGGDVGSVYRRTDYVDKYIQYLQKTVDVRLDGLRIAIDCANGSASVTAQRLFESLGAECYMLSNIPNGVNINADCGSTHLDALIDFVNRNDIDLGLAFDGDADRCLAVDENGRVIDGDKMIAMFALDMKKRGRLKNNAAVVTVMTNMGFRLFAKANEIDVAETKVGDRYVLEEMLAHDYVIGGEQSGHIIFKQYATTGDGQLSGLQFAAIMIRSGCKASELSDVMQTMPQTTVNVKADAAGKALLENDQTVRDAISAAQAELGDGGRILVRASGTEPLIRVMLEGSDLHQINRLAQSIAGLLRDRMSK